MTAASTVPLILESNRDLPLVEVRHIVRTGSVTERPEIAGVGRIALRLLRRGAGGLGRRDLDEAIDRVAAMISSQATPDFYALHVRALTKHLDRAIDLLASMVNEPTLDPEELERLKRESIAELVSSRDDDRHLASRAMRRLVFGDHPYGVSSHGTVETIERITIDDVKRFLAEHVVARSVLVGAAGDADEPGLRRIMDRVLGRLPADVEGPTVEPAPVERRPGVRVLLVDKPERTQNQMLVGHLGPATLDPLDLPLRVALTAFGGTFTSTLMQEVRVKRGWSYGAYASLGRGRFPEILGLSAFPAATDAVACLELLIELFSTLRREGPSAADVAFARDYLARSMALQRDTAPARLTLKLRQEILGLPRDYYDTFAERVREVTVEQAAEAVRTHLDDRNLCISITCTASQLRAPLEAALGPDAQIATIPYDSPEI